MAKKANAGQKITWLNDKKTMISPIGTALWASINKPDDRYGPKFKVSLVVDPDDAQFKKFIAGLKSVVKSSGLSADLVDDLIKTNEDKEGNTRTLMSFSSKAFIDEDTGQYRCPTVYNSKNQPIKATVWGGDEIRVGFKFAHWKSHLGQGLKFYLDSIQLLKKGANSGSYGPAFDVDDSYEPITGAVDTVNGPSSTMNPDALPDNGDDDEDIL